jgi:hypothetical protein
VTASDVLGTRRNDRLAFQNRHPFGIAQTACVELALRVTTGPCVDGRGVDLWSDGL